MVREPLASSGPKPRGRRLFAAIVATAAALILSGCGPDGAKWVSGVSVTGGSLTWDAFAEATGYQVVIAEQAVPTPTSWGPLRAPLVSAAPRAIATTRAVASASPTGGPSTPPAATRTLRPGATVVSVSGTSTAWDPPADGLIRVAVFALKGTALLACSQVQAYACTDGVCAAVALPVTAK